MLVVVNKLFMFSSVLKQNMIFFSILSGLLYKRNDSNFFKIAVEGSDSMKRNNGGFTFKEEAFIAYRNPNTAARTQFNFKPI